MYFSLWSMQVGWHVHRSWLRVGIYYVYIEDWLLRNHSKKFLHFVMFEEYAKDRRPELQKITEFLRIGELLCKTGNAIYEFSPLDKLHFRINCSVELVYMIIQ